jgi:ribosomal protein S18 acetylase RimI-like enzyme
MNAGPLERPVWHALTGRQAALGSTHGRAVRVDPRYGPFAAARDTSDAAQADLASIVVGSGDMVAIVEQAPWPVPPGLALELSGDLLQLVAERPVLGEPDDRVERLGDNDAADMAELALATEPGPWAALTHRYGTFHGIRANGRLAAMAGERFLLPGYAEVSAVCTWPEFRRQGMAAALIREVMRGFVARGDVPFLHSYESNAGALRVYENLGFRATRTMALTVLGRP